MKSLARGRLPREAEREQRLHEHRSSGCNRDGGCRGRSQGRRGQRAFLWLGRVLAAGPAAEERLRFGAARQPVPDGGQSGVLQRQDGGSGDMAKGFSARVCSRGPRKDATQRSPTLEYAGVVAGCNPTRAFRGGRTVHPVKPAALVVSAALQRALGSPGQVIAGSTTSPLRRAAGAGGGEVTTQI